MDGIVRFAEKQMRRGEFASQFLVLNEQFRNCAKQYGRQEGDTQQLRETDAKFEEYSTGFEAWKRKHLEAFGYKVTAGEEATPGGTR